MKRLLPIVLACAGMLGCGEGSTGSGNAPATKVDQAHPTGTVSHMVFEHALD